MIDRTDLDLRLAAHATRTDRINRQAWWQGRETRQPVRAALATLLVTLAARLDATILPARREATALPAPTRA